MGPANSIFSKAATWGHHLVESSNTIAGLELVNVAANLMNYPRDIIARVHGLLRHDGSLPILGIGTRHDDFGHDLVIFGDRYLGIHDIDLQIGLHNGFLHRVVVSPGKQLVANIECSIEQCPTEHEAEFNSALDLFEHGNCIILNFVSTATRSIDMTS